jgi:hypothetical protein
MGLTFTANQAFDTYAAAVAWSLYAEAHHLLPWSILDSPAAEVAEYYDSRYAHARITGSSSDTAFPPSIVPGRDFWNAGSRQPATWEATCDPRVGDQFMTGQYGSAHQSLIGATPLATLKNITGWFYNNVGHGGAGLSTDYVINNNFIYLSGRLAPSLQEGHTLVQAQQGCHSAATLFYDLAKSVNIPVLNVGETQPSPGALTWDIQYRHGALVYGWGNPATTLLLEHVDDIYANYGLIFPVDANGQPASDVAQSLFDASWVPPGTLAGFGFVLTNDWAQQSVNSTYYYDQHNYYPINDQGVLVGNWPAAVGAEALVNNLNDVVGGTLCSYLGAPAALQSCWQDNPALYENAWQGDFGRPYLTSPNGNVTGAAYLQHLQTCAAAYTGMDGVSACSYLGGANPYRTANSTRAATNYWIGPIGK